jgi:hypothetical protein
MPPLNVHDTYNVASAVVKYTGTPTPMPELATSTIVLIVVAGVIGLLLAWWLTQLGMMYFFYSLDPHARPRNIYESGENNCTDLCCIFINKHVIQCCCPSLLAHEADLFIKPDANTQKFDIVHTGSRFTNANNSMPLSALHMQQQYRLAPIPEYAALLSSSERQEADDYCYDQHSRRPSWLL